MRPPKPSTCSALALLLFASCAALEQLPQPPAPPSVRATTTPAGGLEGDIHNLVNRHRAARGRPPLEWDPALARMALEHSERMAAGSRPFGHDGFEERAAEAQQQLGISRFSENVATNNYPPARAAAQVFEGWIGSPGHLRNLEGEYRLTGVGVAQASSGYYFATQLYAGP